MASEYLVRVKFRDKLRFINFFENELNYNHFLNKGKMLYFLVKSDFYICGFFSVFTVFDIAQNVNFKVKIVDSINTIIDNECLGRAVKLFHHQEIFFLEIIYDVDFEKTIKVVTPFVSIELSHNIN